MARSTIITRAPICKPVTKEYVSELVQYEPDTGLLYWKERPWNYMWNGRWAGKVVGTINHAGYVAFPMEGKMYFGHRIA